MTPESREFTLSSPWALQMSKKKKLAMSLNMFRNTHYRVLAKAKRLYTEEVMREQIQELPGFMEIHLKLVIFPPTRRKYDIDNYGSVTVKFFQDALVHYNRIPDDNYEYITKVEFLHGEVDKHNPRIEITIKEIQHDEN